MSTFQKTPGKSNGLPQPIPLISGKPLRLTFDYLGPLPTSNGKKYLIVATCNATKMAFAKAVTNANGSATINFHMDLITSYGDYYNLLLLIIFVVIEALTLKTRK